MAFGFGASYLTAGFAKAPGPIATIGALGAISGLIVVWRYFKINEARLLREADAVLSQQKM
jgi:hypothetical protein